MTHSAASRLADRGHGPTGAASVVVGVGGGRRSAGVAAVVDGRLEAFSDHERVTRMRGSGLQGGVLPEATLRAVLGVTGRRDADVTHIAYAGLPAVPTGVPNLRVVDHHRAHAATAAFTSPFDTAAVIVCDRDAETPVTVWRLERGELTRHPWPWRGPGLAALYSECAALFGLGDGAEHHLEALARLDPGDRADALAATLAYHDGTLDAGRWQRTIAEWLAACGGRRNVRGAAAVASAFQRALGNVLAALVADVRAALPYRHLCLGGGLFYNATLTTRAVESGIYDGVYVPPNPGNAGNATGAALLVAAEDGPLTDARPDPFLGPEFAPDAIKATLDNCKLTYEYLSEGDVIGETVKALCRGRLVGWFQGAMEVGPRSLGHRSIVASPFAPHVLENLNTFLKRREPYRAYGLSVLLEEADRHFHVPAPSPFMELEYQPRDPARFRSVMVDGVRRLRVQTIAERPPVFRELHRAFGEAAGAGVLVNTSFNGFHEPVVCSPRDAVRVFYGGGLDLLVLGRFLLRK